MPGNGRMPWDTEDSFLKDAKERVARQSELPQAVSAELSVVANAFLPEVVRPEDLHFSKQLAVNLGEESYFAKFENAIMKECAAQLDRAQKEKSPSKRNKGFAAMDKLLASAVRISAHRRSIRSDNVVIAKELGMDLVGDVGDKDTKAQATVDGKETKVTETRAPFARSKKDEK